MNQSGLLDRPAKTSGPKGLSFDYYFFRVKENTKATLIGLGIIIAGCIWSIIVCSLVWLVIAI